MVQSRRWHWLAILCLIASPAYAWYKPSAAHEAAIAQLMTNPNAAEAELANTPSGTEKLDYVLFLHAFRPATSARDAEIRSLLAELKAEVEAKGDYFGKTDFAMQGYDGTDKSLIPSIQTVSLANVADFDGPGYSIPCAILRERPALLEAISPFFGSSGDNWLPASGCGFRGEVADFPKKAFNAYTDETGYDGDDESGTIRVANAKIANQISEQIKLDPRYFLKSDYKPCRMKIKTKSVETKFQSARTALVLYYVNQGLTEKEARRAATRGLLAYPHLDDC